MSRRLLRGLGRLANELGDSLSLPYVGNPPVPIEMIVKEERGSILRCVMPSDGSITFSENSFTIRVNSRDDDSTKRRRERFTIAHELGHVMFSRLKKKMSDDATFLIELPLFPNGERTEEAFCNVFAASLLVPSQALLGRDASLSIDGLIHDSFRWDVSLPVMAWRAVDLVPGCLGAAWFKPLGVTDANGPLEVSVEWSIFADSRNRPPDVLTIGRSTVFDSLFSRKETINPNVRVGFGVRKWPYTVHMKKIGKSAFALFLRSSVGSPRRDPRLTDFDKSV